MEINFTDIFKNLPYECIVLKPDKPKYTVEFVNEKYKKSVGKEEKDLIGFGLFEVFPDVNNNLSKILECLDEMLKDLRLCKPPILRYDIVKETRYWDLTYFPVLNTSGIIEHIVQITQDVTDLVHRGLKID